MCGIGGVLRTDGAPVDPQALLRMGAAMKHRGPDGFGVFVGDRVGLAHVRLSIIDVERGAQPLGNEDGRVLIVYNGEVYNYIELRDELQAAGHRFRTRSDTEVLVHAYEQWGEDMLGRLNGQFAFAIYDRRDESLFLARDRFGVRPLFYALRPGALWFASECKAMFAGGEVEARPDPEGLDQVFTFWAALPPRTVFQGVRQLEPGTWARWRNGRLESQRYYRLEYGGDPSAAADARQQLDDLMQTGVKLRMRADVPVGGYLSGGLDSSVTCALAARLSPYALRTFSVTFADPALNEAEFQRTVAEAVGSEHAVQAIGATEIAGVFPDVIWHAETPLVRTAPAPLFLLSRLTRDRGIKVVLTGEGADELFWGYDLFKETSVRLFCARQPQSTVRPRLFDRLYPYLGNRSRTGDFWRRFFLSAGGPDDPLFSHLPRFLLASRIKDYYAAGAREAVGAYDALEDLRSSLPPAFAAWRPLARAAYLEMVTLLSPYLLSSQGDRVSLAHGVEGRYPFLDHRLFEFAARLPDRLKLRGLREKDVLRRWAQGIVPSVVLDRHKQPYRAPDVPPFFGPGQPDYVRDALSPDRVREAGVFNPEAVTGLTARAAGGRVSGFRESQAFVALLSTQLWWHRFCRAAWTGAPLERRAADVWMEDRQGAADQARALTYAEER
jgi:asparagine synthase (glutamine-hydrolysing)